MTREDAVKIVQAARNIVPDRVTWDTTDEAGEFPPNELANDDAVLSVVTDDVGYEIVVDHWMNGAPVPSGWRVNGEEAEYPLWVFYFD